MSKLELPPPKSPVQERAHRVLRALEQRPMSRPKMIEFNHGNAADTTVVVRYLRDEKLIYILCWKDGAAVYALGCEPDARTPGKKKRPRIAPAPRAIKIPAPDPLLAALFGRG